MEGPQLRLMSSYGVPEDFSGAFSSKLMIRESSPGNETAEEVEEDRALFLESVPSSSALDPDEEIEDGKEDGFIEDDGGDEDDDDEDEDCEFSFAPNGQDSSPVSADEMFSDGLIRPVFPLFDRRLLFAGDGEGEPGDSSSSSLRPPLRKLFMEGQEHSQPTADGHGDEDIAGPYCEWTSGKPVVETSPEACRKSNSTGFSKLWRFRDLVGRSSSDGKDAFVFLSPPPIAANKKTQKIERIPEKPEPSSSERRRPREDKKRTGGRGKATGQTASLAYTRNREAKERQRRRSYLPYRQDLLGFFTNVNGLSRNVHPF